MRAMFKIILFLIIFNACLVMFSVYFATDTQGTLYNNAAADSDDGLLNLGIHPTTWGIVGVGVLVSAGFALFGKSPVYIGVSIFSTFFLSMWNQTSQIIYELDTTNNATIAAVVALIGVVIVVLTAFTVIDMFSGQGAME